MLKKTTSIAILIAFLNLTLTPLYSYTDIPQFICETGLKFYQQGRYDVALEEFNKALIVEPGYQPALKYIQMVKEVKERKVPESPMRAQDINQALDLAELAVLEKDAISRRHPEASSGISQASAYGSAQKKSVPKKEVAPKVLMLEEALNRLSEAMEIEQDKSIIVIGKNITRYLVTEPDILVVEQTGSNELLITGKQLGPTYVYIWDDNGRWTEEFQVIFSVPEGLISEEQRLQEEERAGNFKLSHNMSWSSFETGRRLKTMRRTGYSWSHGLSLTGDTPYGRFDSSTSIRSNKTNTDISYFTLGLTNGLFEQFKDFTLRGFDFGPPFSNLAFSGATLRGGILSSPMFNKKLDYSVFWGREGGGRYGNLSPSLSKIRDSFLDGFNLNFLPHAGQYYTFSVVHGWGRDRTENLSSQTDLNAYNYDLKGRWNFGNRWGLGYEIANDTERFAHILNTQYSQSKLNLSLELRNIDEHYSSITGAGSGQGELSGVLRADSVLTDKLGMNSSLYVFRDRLFPAEDNDKRLNEHFDWGARYQLDPSASYNLSYSLRNELGRISQYRYQSAGLGVSKMFHFAKDISTFANYYHQINKNYSSPSSDYNGDSLYLGLRFSLISDLYYYLNKSFTLYKETFTKDHSLSHITDTGVDWSRQIGKTPLYGNFRFSFHDEESKASNINLISGEDYIEGYSELSYHMSDYSEIYGSGRFRNVWLEAPSSTKRMELAFNAGMRYLWDTGIRWESIGTIDGYVFKDYNMDGLRENGEPGVSRVKILLGKDKSELTDDQGYYIFKKVKAKKAYVAIDTDTIPSGLNLTTSQTQTAAIRHGKKVRLDFGIMSQTEIGGMVFIDEDGNGRPGFSEIGIRGIIISLDDSIKTATDDFGRFFFSKLSPGEHTLKLDIDSLPVEYLPQVPLVEKISLSEGERLNYDFPVRGE